MAQLLVDVPAENRRKRRFLLHEFVIMPNHFHLLLTPAAEIPLERHCNSSRAVSPIARNGKFILLLKIWQASFVNHRIRDAEDYKHHHTYIWENPVRAGLSERPELFCLVIGLSGDGIGRPATRAKALNLYTGTFSRV